jgi:fructokinase
VIRLGVDFGGTKIEAAALGADGGFVARVRRPNPGGYDAALETVAALVAEAARDAPSDAPVGVGVPGSVSPRTGLIRNANSTWLNGRPFREDMEARLGRRVRIANDANCFALSEAAAFAPDAVVFGAILGTGCGGGVVVRGALVEGVNGIGGEWGHTPLPWPNAAEWPGPRCWCGRLGCLETWISGSGFEADFARVEGRALGGPDIVAAARAGDAGAAAALDRYVDRLGRGLAVVADILDPDVIVLGGGMSKVDELYERTPEHLARHLFSDVCATRIVAPRQGDSSGVRGAAWLWQG